MSRSRSEGAFLRLPEVEKLRRAVPGDEPGTVEYALYLTAALAGQREEDLLALRWQDLDLELRMLSCPPAPPWSPLPPATRRRIPLASRLACTLADHRHWSAFAAESDLVFADPQTGGRFDVVELHARFAAALRRASLRRLAFDDLRRTFGVHMREAGAPLRAVAYWMGDPVYPATSRYISYTPDETNGLELADRAFGPPVRTSQVCELRPRRLSSG